MISFDIPNLLIRFFDENGEVKFIPFTKSII